MKLRDWVLEVEPEGGDSRSRVIRLGVKNSATQQILPIVAPCGSLEEFQQEIARIKNELDEMERQAEEIIHALAKTQGKMDLDLAEIWRKMESLPSEEEMFDYFNSFKAAERQQLAEYIFSHVNMFKGRGPVFSENYDGASQRLG